jgi:Fe-S-cluster-containing hydrogenase component 2
VVKIEDIGIDYPVICRQCEERYCTKCPESAIEIGPEGQMIVTPTLCTSCGTCETLCPIGAIELYEGIPYVCDLCGGKPRCVEQCNMGAINYESEHDEPASLKTFKKSSKGLNPEEKRVLYALDRARELLDQWKSTVGG